VLAWALLPSSAVIAGGRQVPHVRQARRLLQHRHRQMGRAIEAAGTVDDLPRALLGVGDELFERLVGLLIVDQEEDRIGRQPRQRNEVGAGGLGLPAEQVVNFGVAGESIVVREQGVAVRLGAGGKLRADRAGGAGLGFDHDRLLEDGFERGRDRPGDQIVGAAGRERVDDGHGARGKRLLRERIMG
jgi:hypothetical protein